MNTQANTVKTPIGENIKSGNIAPPQLRTTPLVGLRPEVVSHADLIARNIAEAESRKLTLQTEAAINLAVGLVLSTLGETSITISPAALSEFSETYRVEQHAHSNGEYTLTIVERK